jgi:hypothetical protein
VSPSIYVPLVLEAIEQLEGELVRVHHNVRGIAAWPASSSVEIASIRASIRRARGVTWGLRGHTLALGENDDSDTIRASSLRARAIVMAIHLSEMERLGRGLAEHPIGRFPDVDAFKDHLLGEVGRINATWMSEAKQAISHGASDERDTLARTEAAYAALGRQRDVAEILAWGAARPSLAFSTACRVLALMLDASQPASETGPRTDGEVPTLPSLGRKSVGAPND